MTDKSDVAVHWSFWVIGIISLLWYVMGSMNLVAQMTTDVVASMSETHRAIIENRPVWATAGFALGVLGGALGCILLLLRKSAAFPVFIVSLAAVVVTTLHTVRIASSGIEFGMFDTIMMIVMSPVVAALLIWYSWWVARKGWMKNSLN